MSLPNQILTFTQIALETLPISSSAHVILVKKLYATLGENPVFFAEYFYQLCNIPTLLVLLLYFRRDLRQVFFCGITDSPEQSACDFRRNTLRLFGLAFLASTITTTVYFLSKKMPPYQFMPTHPLLIVPAMLTTALLLFSLNLIRPRDVSLAPQLSALQGFVLGVVQTISLTPGISRFAGTYVTLRWFGNTSHFALRYSFLLHSILTGGLLVRAVLCRWEQTMAVLSAHLSWTTLPVVLLSMAVSYIFLGLAEKMGEQNRMWVFGVYLILPISTILLLWALA